MPILLIFFINIAFLYLKSVLKIKYFPYPKMRHRYFLSLITASLIYQAIDTLFDRRSQYMITSLVIVDFKIKIL